MFFGLGSDGTVGANKNTIKILGAEESLHAQGYFVYDSKKSGSQTVSHLRFGPAADPRALPGLSRPASSAATSSACSSAPTCSAGPRPARRCCSTARTRPDEVWDALPRPVQEQILAKRIELYAIDAGRIAREAGLAGRTNTVLQTCFFAISGVLPARRGDRARSRRRSPRPTAGAARRSSSATRPRSTARWTACTAIEVPGRVTVHPRAAAGGARARAGVRPHRDRGDDGRPRRRPAGQRAAGGRHLPERHRRVREAQHLRAGRRVGPRPVHPVRQLQLRLPAQRDPLHATTTQSLLAGAPDGFRSAPLDARGLPGHPLHAPGLRRGLHRLRAVRRGLPGRGAGGPGAQGDQPRAARAAGGRRAGEHRVLRDAAGGRPRPGWTSARCAAPSSCSRCSSSPAPARAAARRRTSSCCRSCSATG